MRLLIRLGFVLACTLLPAPLLAQPGSAPSQFSRPPCSAFYSAVNARIKVILKDGRKIKGKVIAQSQNQLELATDNKTMTFACADIARVQDVRRFRHLLKIWRPLTFVVGATLAGTGYVVAVPGIIIAKTGAEKVGSVIAAPGLGLILAGMFVAEH